MTNYNVGSINDKLGDNGAITDEDFEDFNSFLCLQPRRPFHEHIEKMSERKQQQLNLVRLGVAKMIGSDNVYGLVHPFSDIEVVCTGNLATSMGTWNTNKANDNLPHFKDIIEYIHFLHNILNIKLLFFNPKLLDKNISEVMPQTLSCIKLYKYDATLKPILDKLLDKANAKARDELKAIEKAFYFKSRFSVKQLEKLTVPSDSNSWQNYAFTPYSYCSPYSLRHVHVSRNIVFDEELSITLSEKDYYYSAIEQLGMLTEFLHDCLVDNKVATTTVQHYLFDFNTRKYLCRCFHALQKYKGDLQHDFINTLSLNIKDTNTISFIKHLYSKCSDSIPERYDVGYYLFCSIDQIREIIRAVLEYISKLTPPSS